MSLRLSILGAALSLSAAALSPPAHAVTITRGFSGLWHDSAQANRGFSAEVVRTESGKKLLAYWFTTDAAGKPLWVIGEGPIVGNRAVLDAVVGSASAPTGTAQGWGKLNVAFTDCAHGTVQFVPNDPRQSRGQTTIARLSDDSSSGCTGGISDDRVASNDLRIVQFFTNTGVVPAASGKARFEERSDRTDFKVEAEDLPIGAYSLRVAGTERATLNVFTTASGTEGEVEFRSPVEPGKILLDFDPRGMLVEVAQGNTVFLTTKLGTEPGGGDSSGGASGGGETTRYVLNIETTHDGPELEAEYELRANSTEFKVELEDFAAGAYTLNVGGTERGTIDVVAVQGGTEGEIEFRDPPEPNHFNLDFDPRGQSVQILQNGAVLISGTFPTEPTDGDDGGGGGNGGGGNDDPPGDDHGGHGNDDSPGDDHGGHGNDDSPGDDHGGSGGHHGGSSGHH